MSDQDPAAQGQQTGAETQANDVQETEVSKLVNGFQQRIDQLTARNHEKDSKIEELIAQTAQLLAIQQQREVPAPQDPKVEIPEGLDPAVAQFMERMLQASQAPLLKQIEALKAQTLPTAVTQQMTEVQQKLQEVGNPLVSARVTALIQGFQKAGYLQNGTATPMDALKIAAGEMALGQLGPPAPVQSPRQEFNAQGGQALLGGRLGLPATTGPGQTRGPKVAGINAVDEIGQLSQRELNKLVDEVDNAFPDGVPL